MVWKRLKINYLTKMLPFLRYFDIIVVSTKLSGADRGVGGHSPPLTDSGRGVALPLNLEFFVPIFRIASQ